MSQKMKKTMTSSFTSSRTGTQSASNSPIGARDRSQRSPSPTALSRMEEKNELASLNDRLAAYIDKVRSLETENSRLSRIIQTHEEEVSRDVSGVKAVYDKELAQARRLLDEIAKDKAKLQIEVGKLKSEVDELRHKLKDAESGRSIAERRLLEAESQINELNARLNDSQSQHRHFEDEFNRLKKECEALQRALAVAKKQLEDETVARVDLENRLQSLKEELAFKSRIHQEELNESLSRTSRMVYEEVDDRVAQDYASKLADALRDMREENEEQIRAMRDEYDTVLDRKIAELRMLSERGEGPREKLELELRSSRKTIDSLTSENDSLKSRNAALESRIRDLEAQLDALKDERNSEAESLRAQLRNLRKQLEDQLQEYRDLMDIKIQLDTEIAAYRKLLESEESRLNLSQHSETSSASKTTPRKRRRDESLTPIRGSRRLEDSSSASALQSKSSVKDVIEISEVCPEGKFVQLKNLSDTKDVVVGGWQITLTGGGQETTYKFSRNAQMKAGQVLTVWSSSSGQTHSPPDDYVMNGKDWFPADIMKVSLLNKDNEEVAWRESTRSQSHTSYTSVDTGRRHDFEELSSGAHQRSSSGKWGWSLFGVFT